MALVVKDRVQVTSTTTGTGTFTLGSAVSGFQDFSVIGNANTTYYAIVGQGTTEWEIGIGTYTSSGTTLSRDTILESSNGGTAVNFSAGTKNVFVTYPAEKSLYLDASNNAIALGTIAATTTLTNATGLPISTGVSGLGTGVATFLGTPSSSNLASAITDETGSGSLVFATSPTIASPTFTSQATFAAGTAATPSVTTTGDTNTGMFFPAADTIAFAEGGTEAMRIDSSGNVGIGTTSVNAQTRLAIAYTNRITDARGIVSINSTDAAAANLGGSLSLGGQTGQATAEYVFGSVAGRYEGSGYSGYLQLATTRSDGTVLERMRIDSSGNVGIGTTSPSYLLNVSKNGGGGDSAQFVRITDTSTSNSIGPLHLTIGAANHFAANPSPVLCGTNGIAFGVGDGSDLATQRKMTIDSSGNVGIGTTSPATKLHLLTSSATAVALRAGNSASYAEFQVDASGNSQLIAPSGVQIFNTNGAERMRIDSSGNVGIGTTSPSTYASATRKVLSINNIDNVLTLGSYYESGIGQYTFINSSNAAGSGNIDLVFSTGSNTERMRITSGGLLQFNSGYGSVATAYGCRAWVNFNGTGTPAIRASGNVTSITDNGTGDYTVNFTTAMPDANYSVSGMTACLTGTGSPGYVVINHPTTAPTSSAVRIRTQNDANTATDYVYVCVDIHR